ncbi:hypothetical protein KRMM14A1259_57720 [Krasilnikovia sp. MM14-A1259]
MSRVRRSSDRHVAVSGALFTQRAKTRVEQLAKQACTDVPKWPGESATHWGTRVHTRFAELVDDEPESANLFSEFGYRNGRRAIRWKSPVTGR